MNNVSLVGRLTRDPELKYTTTGQAVATFTLAVDNQFMKDKQADFINCVVWAKGAELLAQYCKKGRQVALVGRIQTRNYEGQDGRKVYVTEVVATQITYLQEGKGGTQNEPSGTSGLLEGSTVTDFDDLPFN